MAYGTSSAPLPARACSHDTAAHPAVTRFTHLLPASRASPPRRPGAYAAGNKWVKETHHQPRQAGAAPRNFPVFHAATTPSIPTFHQSFGYEEAPGSRSLVLQPPPAAQTTEEVMKMYSSNSGKAAGFGRSRADRTDFAKLAAPTPAPGADTAYLIHCRAVRFMSWRCHAF